MTLHKSMAQALLTQPYGDTTMYVVGESDDYIDAVFTNPAVAEAYAKASGPFFWVEPAPLDPRVPGEERETKKLAGGTIR